MNHTAALPLDFALRAGDNAPVFTLTDEERADVAALADSISSEGIAVELRLEDLALLALDLPTRLRAAVVNHRVTGRPYGGIVVANLPIDEAVAGPTPLKHGTPIESTEANRASVILLLIGSLLGSPVSYLSQQRGKMVLDLFPIEGHEHEQLGSSSRTLLEWHNEDAFHPLRADWIMLLAIRNHDKVPTTFAPVQDMLIEESLKEALFQEKFVILPDESHTSAFNDSTTGVGGDERQAQAFQKISEMSDKPQPKAILSGDPEAPFICIDPAFMPRERQGDAVDDLDQIVNIVDGSLRDLVLAPGDLLILDNKRAVHGRRPFAARYDGTDRWLRRINVLADLRQAEGRRFGAHGRALV